MCVYKYVYIYSHAITATRHSTRKSLRSRSLLFLFRTYCRSFPLYSTAIPWISHSYTRATSVQRSFITVRFYRFAFSSPFLSLRTTVDRNTLADESPIDPSIRTDPYSSLFRGAARAPRGPSLPLPWSARTRLRSTEQPRRWKTIVLQRDEGRRTYGGRKERRFAASQGEPSEVLARQSRRTHSYRAHMRGFRNKTLHYTLSHVSIVSSFPCT